MAAAFLILPVLARGTPGAAPQQGCDRTWRNFRLPSLAAVVDSGAVARLVERYERARPEPVLASLSFRATGEVAGVWISSQDLDAARRALADSLRATIKPQPPEPKDFAIGLFWGVRGTGLQLTLLTVTCPPVLENRVQIIYRLKLAREQLQNEGKDPDLLRATTFLVALDTLGHVVGASFDHSSGNREADSMAYDLLKALRYSPARLADRAVPMVVVQGLVLN